MIEVYSGRALNGVLCICKAERPKRQPAEPDLAKTSGGIAGGFLEIHHDSRRRSFNSIGEPMKKLILTLLAATAFAATAAAKDSLSVYTYDSFAGDYGPGKAVKAAFEKTCEIGRAHV